MWHVQVTMFPWKSNIYYILWVCICVLALVIHHARCIFSAPCYVAICGLALQIFFTLSHKQHNFQKNLLNIKCLFSFFLQLMYEISHILRIIQLVIFITYIGVHVILFRFLIFSTDLKKKMTSNFIKICPLGAELLHVDRQTHRHDNANSYFSQFCKCA